MVTRQPMIRRYKTVNAARKAIALRLKQKEKMQESKDRCTRPLVSIIIPCFNQGVYLNECIDSIKNQTYDNIEIVLVNDASTDGVTENIINEFKSIKIKNRNIAIIHNEKNLGLPGTRNEGINASIGEFILPLDADDKISSNFISSCVSEIIKGKKDIIRGRTLFFGSRTGEWVHKPYNFKVLKYENVAPCTCLFKKIHWEEVGGYKEDMVNGYEDWEFWINMGKHGHTMGDCKEAIFYYRQKSKSMVVESNKIRSMLQHNIRMMHKDLYKPEDLQLYKIGDKKKLAMVTMAEGPNYKKMFEEVSERRMREYARKIGADFIVWDNHDGYQYHVFKKLDLGKLLDDYDRVAFIDSDIIIKKNAPNIFEYVPEDCVGMCNEHCSDYMKETVKYYNQELEKNGLSNKAIFSSWDGMYFNGGVIVVSKCHKHIFEYIFTETLDHWAEQGLINYQILRHKVKTVDIGIKFNGIRNFMINCKYTPKMRLHETFFLHENINMYHADEKLKLLKESLSEIEKIENSFVIWKKTEKLKIKVIALCYNEEKMIPFFLRHYSTFCDKIVIYDNFSTDRSKDILSKNSKVDIVQWNSDGRLEDKKYLEIKNTSWMGDKKEWDWVIVCDMDEFIYHPNILEVLQKYKFSRITFPRIDGYQMVNEGFPADDGKTQIYDIVKTGFHDENYAKRAIFNPKSISSINYLPGAHLCKPRGIVKQSPEPELKLLHYKFFGHKHWKERAEMYAPRLVGVDYDWGQHVYTQFAHGSLELYKKEAHLDEVFKILP